MKVLVVTSEPVSAQQLQHALPDAVDDPEVMVVAPALQESGLRFWLSDADEAIAKADAVRRKTMDELDKAGVPASGDTGESDPVEAIVDALETFDADRIVVFTHQGGDRHYREDFDEHELEQRLGRPVELAAV